MPRAGGTRQTLQYLKAAGNKIGNTLKRAYQNRKKTEPNKRRKPNTMAKEGRIYNEGIGGQYSEFNWSGVHSFIPKEVMDAGAPQVELYNTGEQLLCTPGVQASSVVMTLADSGQYNLVSTNSKITRFILNKIKGEIFFANNFKANVRMTIYDCIARRDIPTATINSAYNAWHQGLTDLGLAGTETVVGATPFSSDTFNFFWKVAQRTEVVLSGGGVHRHKVQGNMRKLIAGAEGAYLSGWKDCSYNCLIVISGQPAHDSTTKTNVTLGTGGVDMVVQTEHVWKYVLTGLPTISKSNNLATTFAVGEAETFVAGPAQGANAQA